MSLHTDTDKKLGSDYGLPESYVNKPREDAINEEINILSGKLQGLNAKNMACGNTLTPKIRQLNERLKFLRRELAMDTFLGFKTGVRRSAALQTMTGQDIRNIPGVIDFREDPKNHSVLIFIDDPNV